MILRTLFMCSLAAARLAQATEHWYVVSYAGEKVGFMSTETAGLETRTHSKMVFKRLGASLAMESSSKTLETSDGKLASFQSRVSSSKTETDYKGILSGLVMKLTVTAAGKSYERDVPLKQQLVGPEAADRLSSASLRKPGDTVHYWTIQAESGMAIEVQRTFEVEDRINLNGNKVSASKVLEVDAPIGFRQEAWLAEDGSLLKSKSQTPIGEADTELCPREIALHAESGGALPSDAFERSLVKTNVRLPNPRSLERVVLRLTARRLGCAWPDFNTEGQRVLSKAPDHLIVEVSRPSLPGSGDRKPAGIGLGEYLKPNELIQSDAADVIRLEKSIVKTETDPWRKAAKLRDWEATNMHFDGGIAAAPSSEVARDRHGTCFAYSTLLCAMCRAAGVPARFEMGYGYADGIYGGHAWVEVRIGSHWIPLDGALWSPGVADAARLAFVSTSLNDGFGALGSALQAYGAFDVQVIGFSLNGHPCKVGASDAPYIANGRTYENAWLGIRETLPSGFRFTKLNGVYPDDSIFTASNGKTTLSLSEGVDRPGDGYWPDSCVSRQGGVGHRVMSGQPASYSFGKTKATAAIRASSGVWVIHASGPKAGRALRGAIAGWRS